MKTLKEILTGDMTYDNSWKILARQDSEGNFSLDSEAQFYSTQFETPTGWAVVSRNADYMDAFTKYAEVLFHYEEAQEWKLEFAQQFLSA